MNASGIGLTDEELGLLINRYRVPAGNGAIDYQKFCDQTNKVWNNRLLVPHKHQVVRNYE